VAVNGEDGVVVLVDQLLIPGSSGSSGSRAEHGSNDQVPG
jgi:hypothetical protein